MISALPYQLFIGNIQMLWPYKFLNIYWQLFDILETTARPVPKKPTLLLDGIGLSDTLLKTTNLATASDPYSFN
jgi:hypothetical protein